MKQLLALALLVSGCFHCFAQSPTTQAPLETVISERYSTNATEVAEELVVSIEFEAIQELAARDLKKATKTNDTRPKRLYLIKRINKKQWIPGYREAKCEAWVSTKKDGSDRYKYDELKIKIEMPCPILDSVLGRESKRNSSKKIEAVTKCGPAVFGPFKADFYVEATVAGYPLMVYRKHR